MNRDAIENPTDTLYYRVMRALTDKRDVYRRLGNDNAAATMAQAAIELKREYERILEEMRL